MKLDALIAMLSKVNGNPEVVLGDFTSGKISAIARPKTARAHCMTKQAQLDLENSERSRKGKKLLTMREWSALAKAGDVRVFGFTLNDVFAKETDEVSKVIVLSASEDSTGGSRVMKKITVEPKGKKRAGHVMSEETKLKISETKKAQALAREKLAAKANRKGSRVAAPAMA